MLAGVLVKVRNNDSQVAPGGVRVDTHLAVGQLVNVDIKSLQNEIK